MFFLTSLIGRIVHTSSNIPIPTRISFEKYLLNRYQYLDLFFRLHKGQSPAEAELNFLEHAKRLEMYGISLHPGKVVHYTRKIVGSVTYR